MLKVAQGCTFVYVTSIVLSAQFTTTSVSLTSLSAQKVIVGRGNVDTILKLLLLESPSLSFAVTLKLNVQLTLAVQLIIFLEVYLLD